MSKKKTRKTRKLSPKTIEVQKNEPKIELKQESKVDWDSLLISSPKDLQSDLFKTLWVSIGVTLVLAIITWLNFQY